VASADSYHVEDLHPIASGIKVTETRTTHGATTEITTRYEVDR
jgi:hypothetical protein